MADRVIIPVTDVPLPYHDSAAAITWTASNVADKNRVLLTGREVLIARNVGGTERAIKVTSSLDDYNRTNDVDSSLVAGAMRVFERFKDSGWKQADGYLWFEGAHVDVEWAALRLPS